jgi:hypothetical protein
MAPNSEEAYASAAKAKGFPVNTITLEDGTKAHWIGTPTAKKVILYFHGVCERERPYSCIERVATCGSSNGILTFSTIGGGYVMYANKACYTAIYAHIVAKPSSDTSVLLLSYGKSIMGRFTASLT